MSREKVTKTTPLKAANPTIAEVEDLKKLLADRDEAFAKYDRVVEDLREKLREALGVVEDLREKLREALGVIDIITRENAGEDDESLGQEYGGTGWEKHPAVESVRAVRSAMKSAVLAAAEPPERRAATRIAELDAYVVRLEDYIRKIDPRVAKLEACIREVGRTGNVNHTVLAEVLKP